MLNFFKLSFIAILFINLFLYSNQAKDEDSILNSLKTYYDCITKRMRIVANSLHREAIACAAGETCILKSNNCPKPSLFYQKTDAVWAKKVDSDYEMNQIDFYEDERYTLDPLTNDLTINSVIKSDEGYYYEIIYNTTRIKQFHLTVLEEQVRYPIHESYLAKNRTANEPVALLKGKIESITIWNKWSNCTCLSNTNMSFRLRFGDCHLRALNYKSEYGNDTLTLKKMYGLLDFYKNPIHCNSNLIPKDFKRMFNLTSYIMYSDCSSNCYTAKQTSGDSLEFSTFQDESSLNEYFNLKRQENLKSKFRLMNQNMIVFENKLQIAGSNLMQTETNENIVLECKIKKSRINPQSYSKLSVTWAFDVHVLNSFGNESIENNRIFVDSLYRLNINKSKSSDSGIYKCYLNDILRSVFVVQINENYTSVLYSILHLLSAYLIIFNLILVLIFSFGK